MYCKCVFLMCCNCGKTNCFCSQQFHWNPLCVTVTTVVDTARQTTASETIRWLNALYQTIRTTEEAMFKWTKLCDNTSLEQHRQMDTGYFSQITYFFHNTAYIHDIKIVLVTKIFMFEVITWNRHLLSLQSWHPILFLENMIILNIRKMCQGHCSRFALLGYNNCYEIWI